MENSNKPASPQLMVEQVYKGGLTKREHFAAMAMQGFCSNTDWAKGIEDDWDDYKNRIAAASLETADELLKQLEK